MAHLTESNEELRKQLENCQTNPIEKPEEHCKKLDNFKNDLIQLNSSDKYRGAGDTQ